MSSYITLRAVLAALTALGISFVVGPKVIRKLAAYKIGQSVRDDGPQTHLAKAGTPTMGGALILVAIAITTLLWGDPANRFIWVVLVVTLGFGAVGWVDDYRKVVHRNPKGLSARAKFFWQSVIGLSAALFLAFSTEPARADRVHRAVLQECRVSPRRDRLRRAHLFRHRRHQQCRQPHRWPRRTCHHADGDGRRRRSGVFAYVTGNAVFSKYLGFPYIPGAGELTVVCAAIAGAGLGFLWFNAYPAEVFMGDVGALALGAALGVMAVIVRQEVVLLVMGGVFVVETLSVMLQVASFKLTGKRIFRMAPLHHHYELKGWKENQVVVRFWIISMILVLIGLSTLKLR